jgi:hypothetical protein
MRRVSLEQAGTASIYSSEAWEASWAGCSAKLQLVLTRRAEKSRRNAQVQWLDNGLTGEAQKFSAGQKSQWGKASANGRFLHLLSKSEGT